MHVIGNILRRRGRAVTWLLATDWLILVGAFAVALYFRRYAPETNIIMIRQRFRIVPELTFAMVYALVFLAVFSMLGLYLRKTWLSRWLHAGVIVEAATLLVLGYLLLRGTFKWGFLVQWRHVILYWYALALLGLLVHRLLIFPWLLRVGMARGLRRRVALIGQSDLTRHFLEHWRENPEAAPIEPIGIVTDRETDADIGLPRLGRIADLSRLVAEHRLEGAVICDPALDYDGLMALIEECVRLFGWVDVHTEKSAVWHSRADADKYFDIPFARITSVTRNPFYFAFKRVFDVTASGLALLLLSPLLAVLAVLVKLSSPGPVFYVHHRIGRGGRPFAFYKFRSMRVGADADPERKAAILAHMKEGRASGKVVNEAMITPLGRFIRKWGLDEIPQLWNVIRGDMALVGPRPLPPDEYEAQDPWQKRRFDITPGCTGLWKVMVAKGGGTFDNTVLYDLYYARNMNPLLDLFILFQTAWLVLRGRADAR